MIALALLAALPASAAAAGPPSVGLASKPARYLRSHTARFTFSAGGQAHVRFVCRLSRRGKRSHFRPCRRRARFRRLRNRTYVLRVYARGADGRRSRIKRWRFHVDTVRPRLRIASGPPSDSRGPAAAFGFAARDRSPLRLLCRLGSGAWERCRSPKRFEGLPDGSQQFELQGEDAAGNRSRASWHWNVYTGPPQPGFSTSPSTALPFGWGTRDNVVRCQDGSVGVRVAAPPGWQASVAGASFRSGRFDARVALAQNRRFTVSFRRDSGGPDQVFSVRCLPSDFPTWHFTRSRPGGPQLFMVERANRYVAIYDDQGIPLWWMRAGGVAHNFEWVGDGTLAWDPVPNVADQTGAYEVHNLDGGLVRKVVTRDSTTTDIHELLRLANGNYLVGGQTREPGNDLTSINGPASGTVIGFQIQELTPGGALASTWWKSQGHIAPSETTSRWWGVLAQPDGSYDTQHWNSVEPTDGNTKMLLSFRHLDAVYKVDRASGNVEWKLGGTNTPQSLTVHNDPLGSNPFAGQHDARLQPDGTVSVYDDGSFAHRPPRVVRYRIDPAAKTATLVESFSDPEVTSAFCCGSARRLSDGWLVGWGGKFDEGFVGAYDLSGRRIWKLETPGSDFSYRANPVPSGALSPAQLQAAMDSIYR